MIEIRHYVFNINLIFVYCCIYITYAVDMQRRHQLILSGYNLSTSNGYKSMQAAVVYKCL